MAEVSLLKWASKTITWKSVNSSVAPPVVPRGRSNAVNLSEMAGINTCETCLFSLRQTGQLFTEVTNLLCQPPLHQKHRMLYFVPSQWLQVCCKARTIMILGSHGGNLVGTSWTSSSIPVGSHHRIGIYQKRFHEWPWQLNHFHSLWPPRGMFLICQLVVFQVAGQTTRSLATFPETVNI